MAQNDIYDLLAPLQYQCYTNDYLLQQCFNPIRLYMPKVEGNLLDIGCGQSEYILDFLSSGMNLHALDQSSQQLRFLKRRAQAIYPDKRVEYYPCTFDANIFGDLKFDVIILSQVLHLRDYIEDPAAFMFEVEKVMTSGTLVYIDVHSEAHPESDSHRRFTYEELMKLTPPHKYDLLLHIQLNGLPHLETKKFYEKLLSKRSNDAETRKGNVDEILAQNPIAQRSFLVRRK